MRRVMTVVVFAAAVLMLSLVPCVCTDMRFGDRPKVVTYPVPDAVSDSPYTVTVDGKSVPIEKSGAREGAYYARLQNIEAVRVEVEIKASGITDVQLKPERFRNNLKASGNKIAFDVKQAGPRVITVKADGKELWPLIVIVDDYNDSNPLSKATAVYNIRNYVNRRGIQTANIQKALDDCAAKGGGVVYFPVGIYRTGTIRIKDNTTVYLAPGSLIRGSEDPADYPVDPGRQEIGTHGPVCSFSRLVMFDHCKNSSIIGYGVIDGNGHIVRNQKKRHVQLMDVTGSSNIKIENIALRDSAEWTLHILGCDNVEVNSLKIINDWGVSNTDGIDPDGSQNVSISRYFGFCGDDAVAIKTTGNSGLLKPAVNIRITDSVVMTRKTSYKIGTETYADVNNVLFQNCEAVNSSRGIGLWMKDGSTISDVTFRNMKLDLREIGGEGMSGEPIRAIIEPRDGIGKIRNIRFDRIQSSSPYACLILGVPESFIEDMTFTKCVFKAKPREIKMVKKPLIRMNYARNLKFNGIDLHWPTGDTDNWDAFIGKENSEDIVVQNLRETRNPGKPNQ